MIVRFIIPSMTRGNSFPDSYAFFLDCNGITMLDIMRETFRIVNSVPYDVLQAYVNEQRIKELIDPMLFSRLTVNLENPPDALQAMMISAIEIFVVNFSVPLINAYRATMQIVLANLPPTNMVGFVNNPILNVHSMEPGPLGYDTIIDISAT